MSENDSEGYAFIDDGSDEPQDFNEVGQMWTLGDHSSLSSQNTTGLNNALSETIQNLDPDVDAEVAEVLEDARSLVSESSVSQFECPHEDCGLGHSHPDHKHDIREGFDVTDAFAAQMELVSYCHCGVNELSMLMEFYHFIEIDVFEDGDEFAAVHDYEPEFVNEVYRQWREIESEPDAPTGDDRISEAVQRAVDVHGYQVKASHQQRKELRSYCNRRRDIDRAADSAPIPQKTRALISENRDALLEATA